MKKLMTWLSESFAPRMNALFSRPWLAAISNAMQKIIPFILTGSMIYFYNVFRSYISVLPDLGMISTFSFGLITLVVAFMIANQCMEKLQHPRYIVNAGIVAILLLFMVAVPVGEQADSLSGFMNNVGPSGIAIGMIVGLLVSLVFHLYAKLNIFKDSNIPDFVTGWLHTIFPTFICLTLGMLTINVAHINVYQVIISAFQPIVSIGQTLPGLVLICFIQAFLYSMGISTWVMGSITTPIFLAGIQGNMEAVAAGLPPTNIATTEAVMAIGLMGLGGCGATLTLNILMCFSKSRKLRTMGRISIGPSIFNINEPVMFGTPVVFNPILMIPMWVNAILGVVIVYTIMRLGLLNIPYKLMQIGQIPAPFSSVIVTEDWRALLWYAVIFAVNMLVWYPFYKVYEKQCMNEENEAVKKG